MLQKTDTGLDKITDRVPYGLILTCKKTKEICKYHVKAGANT